jgi:hypothetical protein
LTNGTLHSKGNSHQAGGVAQVVERLPSKCEALSANLHRMGENLCQLYI